jgi:hypothetical protein
MGRPYPNNRRRRPGRRLPNRYSGRHDPPQPQGFTPSGFGAFYNILMPGLRGREKRAFFNQVSAWMISGFALGGAMIGYSVLGPLGLILGLGAGIAAGGSTAKKGRFYRR